MISVESAGAGRPRSTPSSSTATVRVEILDAASALFAERGYTGTTTRSIAERVGIRQASLYYHFAGKDEILLELLETSVRPSLEFVERLRDVPNAAAALYALVVVDVGTLLAAPHNIGSLYLAHEVQEARFDTFRAHRTQLQRTYVGLAAATGREEDAAFLGACCMQLVEMVIPIRRDGEPAPGTARSIARACLRVIDAEDSLLAGSQLLQQLGAGVSGRDAASIR